MSENVFVVGADAFNCRQLQRMAGADQYRFHDLLSFDEVKGGGRYPSFNELLHRAEQQLAQFEGSIDAIVGYWDFPVNSMVPLLCERYSLPAPSTESELKCDHKYWARTEQRAVIPQHTPEFCAVDPFSRNPLMQITIPYPFWIKPIKGTDSLLAFKIRNEEDLRTALPRIRRDIEPIGRSFNELLAHVHLPPHIAKVDGYHCIAEGLMTGRQCTVEGHVYAGTVYVHGIIDSINYPKTSSFFRYQYPSRLPRRVKETITEASRKIMERVGLNQASFNIEYFYDDRRDRIGILEINPRISQSHSDLFHKVDGASNHKIMVELALGRKPDFPHRRGEFRCAAKFHLRRFRNGLVARVPSEEELKRIEGQFPGSAVDMIVRPGMRLDELIEQDSYSYDMAHIYVGADDQRQLLERYRSIVDALPLEIVDV